jgi:hypothetical protein
MDRLAEATCAITPSGEIAKSVVRVVPVILSEAPHTIAYSLFRAHCFVSESAHIVAVIFSQASHAITMVQSEPTFRGQSPHTSSP